MNADANKPEPTTPKKNGTHKLGIKTIEGYIVGRDKTVVPPEEVEKLAAIGCKDQEIADWFGVNDNTLRFNFSAELIKGRATLKMSLRRAMFNNAIQQNNTVMQIWLSKNFLGMSDNPLDGDANQPLPWNEYDESELELGTEEEADTLEINPRDIQE
jgi:hypothetical protein